MCLGIPGQIVDVSEADKGFAVVNVGGVRRSVNIAFVLSPERPAADCLGDWVLVHVGFAMSRIDEQEALRTLDLLRELGEMQAELDAMRDADEAVSAPGAAS
ncbi:MAG: HypC/HybG/HupF family hydrogenase formation chaperone [Nevskia sp.]|jgi:hydrogenase expression/formation protein HypC|nr:HypC/HybG/HupF family hydrogenase formation chaperone [Nevskia sp.]